MMEEDWLNISFSDCYHGSSGEDTDDNNNSLIATEGPSKSHERSVDVAHKTCAECSYSSRSRGNLFRHVQMVHKRKRLHCSECTKQFSQRYDLEQHAKSEHRGVLIMCDRCPKTFKTRFSLRRHRTVDHTQETKYKCGICSHRFYEKASYLGHINKHVDAKPYGCLYCHKGFAYKSSLKRHMRTCQGLDTSLACDKCDKRLKTKSSLNAHKKRVHGAKNKICSCGKTFSRQYSLKRH